MNLLRIAARIADYSLEKNLETLGIKLDASLTPDQQEELEVWLDAYRSEDPNRPPARNSVNGGRVPLPDGIILYKDNNGGLVLTDAFASPGSDRCKKIIKDLLGDPTRPERTSPPYNWAELWNEHGALPVPSILLWDAVYDLYSNKFIPFVDINAVEKRIREITADQMRDFDDMMLDNMLPYERRNLEDVVDRAIYVLHRRWDKYKKEHMDKHLDMLADHWLDAPEVEACFEK